MHKDDLMTPKERIGNYFSGKEIDRIPILPFLGTIGGSVSGITLREGRASAQNQAFMQIKCYERLGNDLMNIDYGLHGLGAALGSKLNDPEDDIPAVSEYRLKDLSELSQLDISDCDSKKDLVLKQHLDATQILLEKYSDECGVDITVPGPFTAAASLYPVEKLLRSIRKSPEDVHKLMKLCTQGLKQVCSEFIKLGISITLCDPVASASILSVSNYNEYVKPYTAELVDHIHSLNTEVGYHICGNTTKILKDMVSTGVDMLSLDSAVDMLYAKQTVGDGICLVGNVDPVNVIMLGTAEEIDEAVKKCFIDASDNKNGFIIATGCDIPSKTPLTNLDAFMSSARKYGKIYKNRS